jgi:hypothetical protein
VVASHRDRAAAEGDFHRLAAIHDDRALGDLDAVVLARATSGTLGFTIGADGDPHEGIGCGLARGLALALSPGVSQRWKPNDHASRAAAGIVVDRVAAAVGRGDLRRYGLLLDAAAAALVASTASERADVVAATLSPSDALASGHVRLDRSALAEEVRRAVRTARSAGGSASSEAIAPAQTGPTSHRSRGGPR